MFKKTYFLVVVFLLGLIVVGASIAFARTNAFADDSVAFLHADPESSMANCSVLLEPIQPGETGSRVARTECGSVEEAPEVVVLEPMNPEDIATIEPEWSDQGEVVNGIVKGPSDEADYRCVILLEPIQSGETSSKASEPICAQGSVDLVEGISLSSSFLIARFYDNTNYGSLLVEYYGSSACSATVNYGVTALPSDLDNKFESGRSYSNCDHINVYDFTNYGGATYACGANCSSFFALNNAVSSWRVTD